VLSQLPEAKTLLPSAVGGEKAIELIGPVWEESVSKS